MSLSKTILLTPVGVGIAGSSYLLIIPSIVLCSFASNTRNGQIHDRLSKHDINSLAVSFLFKTLALEMRAFQLNMSFFYPTCCLSDLDGSIPQSYFFKLTFLFSVSFLLLSAIFAVYTSFFVFSISA